jgi:hypothetical protein
MKGTNYRAVYRSLENGKVTGSQDFPMSDGFETTLSTVRASLTQVIKPTVVRISRIAGNFVDTQWYFVKIDGRVIFSRRRAVRDPNEAWQEILALINHKKVNDD